MANDLSAFFATLVGVAAEIEDYPVGVTTLMDCVYQNYDDEPANPKAILNVPIPAQMTASDAGYGDAVIQDITATNKPINFDKHPHVAFLVQDFAQYKSPQKIKDTFLIPAARAIVKSANEEIAKLLTPTNFGINPPIATTGSKVLTSDFLKGYENLSGKDCDILDTSNMSFVMAPRVWTNMLQDDAWTRESTVGLGSAVEAHREGWLRQAYGAALNFDNQMPTSGTTPNRTFTNFYGHKLAIGLAARPFAAAANDETTKTTFVRWKNFSIRVCAQYYNTKFGWVVTLDAGYGVAVVRPEWGQILTTSE